MPLSAMQQSIDISCRPAHSSKPAAAGMPLQPMLGQTSIHFPWNEKQEIMSSIQWHHF